jgi:rhodanese-related sulfurtransferase/rubrerythrin
MPVTDMSADEAKAFLEGRPLDSYALVDVRQEPEYAEFHLPGARLVPLPELAERPGELPRDKPVMVYCRSGRRSAAAAALLDGQGFADIRNLLGGASGWQGAVAEGPRSQGLDVFGSDKTPLDYLRHAYTLEVNLGAFYAGLATTSARPEPAATFARLSRLEEAHKAMVLNLARSIDPGVSHESLAGGPAQALEGGFDAEEARAAVSMAGDAVGALEAGLAFEAQALDLYLRLAGRAAPESAAVVRRLAEEEKGHLKTLGALLERATRAGEGREEP